MPNSLLSDNVCPAGGSCPNMAIDGEERIHLQRRVKDLRLELDQAIEFADQVDEKLHLKTKECAERDKKIAEQSAQLTDLRSQLYGAVPESEHTELQVRYDQLSARTAELDTEVVNLRSIKEDLHKEIDELRFELDTLATELEDLKCQQTSPSAIPEQGENLADIFAAQAPLKQPEMERVHFLEEQVALREQGMATLEEQMREINTNWSRMKTTQERLAAEFEFKISKLESIIADKDETIREQHKRLDENNEYLSDLTAQMEARKIHNELKVKQLESRAESERAEADAARLELERARENFRDLATEHETHCADRARRTRELEIQLKLVEDSWNAEKMHKEKFLRDNASLNHELSRLRGLLNEAEERARAAEHRARVSEEQAKQLMGTSSSKFSHSENGPNRKVLKQEDNVSQVIYAPKTVNVTLADSMDTQAFMSAVSSFLNETTTVPSSTNPNIEKCKIAATPAGVSRSQPNLSTATKAKINTRQATSCATVTKARLPPTRLMGSTRSLNINPSDKAAMPPPPLPPPRSQTSGLWPAKQKPPRQQSSSSSATRLPPAAASRAFPCLDEVGQVMNSSHLPIVYSDSDNPLISKTSSLASYESNTTLNSAMSMSLSSDVESVSSSSINAKENVTARPPPVPPKNLSTADVDVDEDNLSRLAMLSKRNALQPPHLKCSYPCELMAAPLTVSEDEMRTAKYDPKQAPSEQTRTKPLNGTRKVNSTMNKLVGELTSAEEELKHTGLALHDIGNLRRRRMANEQRTGFGNF